MGSDDEYDTDTYEEFYESLVDELDSLPSSSEKKPSSGQSEKDPKPIDIKDS